MKKFEKKDYINILLISVIVIIYSITITRFFTFMYGSEVDWDVQHYVFPDYFRKLFYDTGKILPSFAFNIGNGQNIFNFSYYGLFSPIILLSYFFPFIEMVDYIQIVSIAGVIISSILIYSWIREDNNEKTAFISALLFTTSSPILFHSHRHIMFISYMPFLILALKHTKYYLENNKSTLLIIDVFLIIMCNYFYSVSSIFTIMLYAFCLIFKDLKRELLKDKILKYLKFTSKILVGVILSSIIILPTFYVLLSGRAKSTVNIDYFGLFFPNLSIDNLLFNSYSLGITVISFASIIYNLVVKNKMMRMLSFFLLLIMFFPIFSFILNGTMYVDNKVLIPLLPIVIFLTSNFIKDLTEKKINNQIMYIIIIACIVLGFLNLDSSSIVMFFIQLIILICIFIFSIMQRKKFVYLLLIVVISISYILCFFGDNLYSRKSFDNLNKIDSRNFDLVFENDDNLYRTSYQNYVLHSINRIKNPNYYISSVYSSVSNKNYRQYYYEHAGVEVSQRSYAKISSSKNIFFNLKNANKYIISTDGNVPVGYKRVDDNDTLYVNNDVLPIIYGSSYVINADDYSKLGFPYSIYYDLNSIITSEKVDSNVMPSGIKEYKSIINIPELINEKVEIKKTNSGIVLDAKENSNFLVDLDGLNEKDILFLSFDIENNNNCSDGDLKIQINGISNVLTCKEWKYHNRNNNFKYVISSNEKIDKLDVKISKGIHVISNIKMYYINYDEILKYKDSISEFIIDKSNTKGDVIKGRIYMEDDGYISTSIPYDKGFTIFLNGKKTDYSNINNGFIGIKVNKGEYAVTISYEAPLLKIGKFLTLFGIGIVVLNYANELKRNDKKTIRD